MKGFSGTGLFVNGGDKFIFQGTISCSRGERSAGTQLWAIDTKQYFELMREFCIDSIFGKQDIENGCNKNDFQKKKKSSKGKKVVTFIAKAAHGKPIRLTCLIYRFPWFFEYNHYDHQ